MKALTLWQPWAQLVALEAKRVETRHWRPPAAIVGQRIAIHAARTTKHLGTCQLWPFQKYVPEPDALPLGVVVATAVLARVTPITEAGAAALRRDHPEEHAFGLYTPGRYAWGLRHVQRLATPVAYRGAQGFFEIPDDLLETTGS